jgi:PAS domain S-box-containing protein
MRPDRAALAFGILLASLGEALAAESSPGTRPVWTFGTDWPTLLLFLCLFLMVCIGYTVRRLNKANAQLHDANNRLECQTRDLSGNNDQLKKEVAERRRTESALRASEDFYYSLVETVPHNIFRKDTAGKYTFVNRAFCATLGKPAAEIIGKTDQNFLPADLASRFRREEEQLLAARKQNVTEQSYPTAAGGRICMQMIRTPLFDASGQPVGIQGVLLDLSERKRAESELVSVHRQLIEASRRVGMAEVATGVLHNVGNVLNSVNVSATLVCEQVKKSKLPAVGKVAALLSAHADDPKFLMEDQRGKELPGYLKDLAEHLRKEQANLLGELESLVKYIEHIKEIVVMQQSYAKLSGLSMTVKISDVVEDALRMNAPALTRHEVEVVREYHDESKIIVDKHAVLQILVNLIRNAKYACDESGRSDKLVTLRIEKKRGGGARIQVVDNGVGIPPQNLDRLFERGFTTRVDGHGFGLHSCMLAAKEMGGVLTAHSDGPGLGAVFTLELPRQPKGGTQ